MVKVIRRPIQPAAQVNDLLQVGSLIHQPYHVAIGIDPSLRGLALSVLVDGVFSHAIGWTDKVTLQKKNPHTLCFLKCPKGRTEPNSQMRMNTLVGWTLSNIAAYEEATQYTRTKLYVAMEGYAYSKHSQGLHETHGLCEMIKQGLWMKKIPFRIYDPLSIKLAWAEHGHADKEDMKDACYRFFGHRFEREGSAGENLADATLIAALLHEELEIRAGRSALADVPETIRHVMLRTTDSEPVAIITRPFVTAEASTVPPPVFSS